MELFTKLGYKGELANKIISTIDTHVVRPEVDDIGDLQVVIFVGHRIDEAGRAVHRFPHDREPQARNLIREALLKAKNGWRRLRF